MLPAQPHGVLGSALFETKPELLSLVKIGIGLIELGCEAIKQAAGSVFYLKPDLLYTSRN